MAYQFYPGHLRWTGAHVAVDNPQPLQAREDGVKKEVYDRIPPRIDEIECLESSHVAFHDRPEWMNGVERNGREVGKFGSGSGCPLALVERGRTPD